MVTLCAGPYAPAAGLKVGVDTWMVYAAEPTALFVSLLCVAMASRVSVAETVMALEYTVEAVVGVVPLVV